MNTSSDFDILQALRNFSIPVVLGDIINTLPNFLFINIIASNYLYFSYLLLNFISEGNSIGFKLTIFNSLNTYCKDASSISLTENYNPDYQTSPPLFEKPRFCIPKFH